MLAGDAFQPFEEVQKVVRLFMSGFLRNTRKRTGQEWPPPQRRAMIERHQIFYQEFLVPIKSPTLSR